MDLVNELNGKVALITGSARNIGRATALELARAGAAVVINARQAKDLCEEVAHEVEQAGGRALPVVADITDADAVADMVGRTVKAFGGIDILVNNAAARNSKPFLEQDIEDWDFAMGATLKGAFLCSKACVPPIIERGGGSIVGLGGLNAHRGARGRPHVMAAKAGLGSFMRGLALDLGQYGIRANSVVVGHFDTDRVGSSSHAPPPVDHDSIPLGRLGAPRDMADLIRFLVGPAATYISGQTIHVNGAGYCPM